jgi:hypothetical protein
MTSCGVEVTTDPGLCGSGLRAVELGDDGYIPEVSLIKSPSPPASAARASDNRIQETILCSD